MITEKQIETIKNLQKLQEEQNIMNQYYLTTEIEGLTHRQAREVILTLKFITGVKISFDDLSDMYNDVGVIAG